MEFKAFQDYYPDELSHCYSCGRLNSKGLQIKSYWDGEESVAIYVGTQVWFEKNFQHTTAVT